MDDIEAILSWKKLSALTFALAMGAAVSAVPCRAQETPAAGLRESREQRDQPQVAGRRDGAASPVLNLGSYPQREALSRDLEQFSGGNAGLIIVLSVIVAVVVIVAIIIPW